jgi:hypothetical protein
VNKPVNENADGGGLLEWIDKGIEGALEGEPI